MPWRSRLTSPTPDYRAFSLTGTHADLGWMLGKADGPFVMQPWWAPPASQAFTAKCWDVLHETHAPLCEEYAAYAEAQHLHVDALWRRCCRVNLKAHLRSARTDGEFGEGCSSFALRLPQGMLVGRNYDYLPQQTRRGRVHFAAPHTITSVGARGGVPGGRYDGVNAKGVFIALHVIMTNVPDESELRPGIPFHLFARLVLELCNSAREAADLLCHLPHLGAINYLVADPHEALVIEADPRTVRVRETLSDTITAATNHFEHPDMRALQGRRTFANSCARLDFLRQQRVPEAASIDTQLAFAQHVLADHSAPICGKSGSLTTLWACVAELASRRIRYCPGPPDETPFEDVTL